MGKNPFRGKSSSQFTNMIANFSDKHTMADGMEEYTKAVDARGYNRCLNDLRKIGIFGMIRVMFRSSPKNKKR